MLFKLIFPFFFMFTAIRAEQYVTANCGGAETLSFPPLRHQSVPMPRPVNGEPLRVNISTKILKTHLDAEKEEFEATFFFRQEWKDPRLAFKSKGDEELRLIKNPASIWRPDIFFVNELKNQTTDSVNKDTVVIGHYPDGKVVSIERKTVKARCPVNLRTYPFDTQVCKLQIESYQHTINDLIIEWNLTEDKPEHTESLFSDSFITVVKWVSSITQFRSNIYSSPILEFNISRTPVKIIFRVILPISMIAIFSWLSFLFTRKEIRARLTLCISPIMTYILQINFCTAFFIEPNYLTGLDVWSVTALAALLASLLEYLYVAYKKGTADYCDEDECGRSDFKDRIKFALAVIIFDILSIISVFLSRII